MRTTIRLDDHLHRELKQVAFETHRTLTAVIEDSAREMLYRHKNKIRRAPVELPTFSGDGVHPGVDLNNSASLQDVMESSCDLRRRYLKSK